MQEILLLCTIKIVNCIHVDLDSTVTCGIIKLQEQQLVVPCIHSVQ